MYRQEVVKVEEDEGRSLTKRLSLSERKRERPSDGWGAWIARLSCSAPELKMQEDVRMAKLCEVPELSPSLSLSC